MGLVKHYLEIDHSLHPDISLESSSYGRLSHYFFYRHADIKRQTVDLQRHHIEFFPGIFIFNTLEPQDLAQDRISVAFNPIRSGRA